MMVSKGHVAESGHVVFPFRPTFIFSGHREGFHFN